ncbi:MAG: MBL fold metallo-hydrolase [Bacteroidetes bacterium]|nr:MBL fold metallo-hydrolase [Bacteroidota bacterium]
MLINSELPKIKHGWQGNPLDKSGRFVNHEFPFTPRFSDVWKWQTSPKPHKHEKKADNWRPESVFEPHFFNRADDCLVWLGHAWFFLRLDGINMLIDPVFFPIPLVKQLTPAPYSAMHFTGIDLILLSHDHRDHADEKSIKAITHLNPGATIITGLRMGALLRKWCRNPIVEMGWYQQYTHSGLRISYLPTRHWSRRLLRDTNLRLWGAFMLESSRKRIYAGQDSGYGSHYGELQELFDPIDMALLGIGAFKPEWFMSPAHMGPHDAVKAFNESGAKTLLPMHYGTLDLADEPAGLPYRIMRELEQSGYIHGDLLIPPIGQPLWL